jgi:hypothetical protein
MKKAIWIQTIILALIVSTARPMPLTKAWENAPCLAINSPYPSSIKIYQNTTILLQVETRTLTDDPDIICILYRLDGNANVTLSTLTKTDHVWFAPNKGGYVFYVNLTMQNLAEGNNTLNVLFT